MSKDGAVVLAWGIIFILWAIFFWGEPDIVDSIISLIGRSG